MFELWEGELLGLGLDIYICDFKFAHICLGIQCREIK